jgi:hypothetical protein
MVALALAAALLAAAPASAQFDQAEMMKWASVTQVKYTIVGQFEGHDLMIVDEGGGYANVKDRAEIELVWDQTTAKLVGQATFKNFPSEVAGVRDFEKTCSPPILNSAYEHFTIDKFDESQGGPTLTSTRTYAAADSAQSCTGGRQQIAAKQVQEAKPYVLPQPVLLAISQTSPGISVDPKSSTITVKQDGWTWTHKLSALK